jgi:NADPH-dependent curcumin reductase CurA
MNYQNKQVLLVKRPVGVAKETDFEIVDSTISALQEGEFLVRTDFISLDPAIRGWMNAGTTYMPGSPLGEPMRAFAVGQIIESKNPNYKIGETVQGLLGVQTYAISKGQAVTKCDLSKGEISKHLGILGMPGMTAYFGLLEKAKPLAGETVFVSGAAGIVGATVGQIAKIMGCKVVGSAGGKEKCDYLKSIGFDEVIDYKSEDINQAIKEKIPEGISVYFDNVGGETLDAALANLARGARVIICGAMSQYNQSSPQGPKNYMKIVTARGTISGIIVFDYFDRFPEGATQISEWLTNGQISTKEHIIEGIDHFYETLKMLFDGQNFGKLLLKIR